MYVFVFAGVFLCVCVYERVFVVCFFLLEYFVFIVSLFVVLLDRSKTVHLLYVRKMVIIIIIIMCVRFFLFFVFYLFFLFFSVLLFFLYLFFNIFSPREYCLDSRLIRFLASHIWMTQRNEAYNTVPWNLFLTSVVVQWLCLLICAAVVAGMGSNLTQPFLKYLHQLWSWTGILCLSLFITFSAVFYEL